MAARTISHKELLETVTYNKKTGIFIRTSTSKPTGTRESNGYIKIVIKRKNYRAHRLAWFYVTGEWPIEVDHKNRIRDDNRWINLRKATRITNRWNTTSEGVRWIKNRHKWRASIQANGVIYPLGEYYQKEDALKARNKAKRSLHRWKPE